MMRRSCASSARKYGWISRMSMSRHLLGGPEPLGHDLFDGRRVPVVLAAPARRGPQRPAPHARLPCVARVEREPLDALPAILADPRPARPDIIEVGPRLNAARELVAALARRI